VQSRVVQRGGRRRVGDHVGDGGGAGTEGQLGAGRGIRCPVPARLVDRVECLHPVVEARVLQVRVRVHESGREHAGPVHLVVREAAFGQRSEHPRPLADVHDPSVAHSDRAVDDGRSRHGDHETGGVDGDHDEASSASGADAAR